LSVKAPGSDCEGRFRKALSGRGVAPRDVQGLVCGNRGSEPLRRPSGGFGRLLQQRQWVSNRSDGYLLVLRSDEHGARVAAFVTIAFVIPATTAETAIPGLAALGVVASRILPVPPGQSPCDQPGLPHQSGARRLSGDCAKPNHARQWIIGRFWLLFSRDGSCRRRRGRANPILADSQW